MQLRHTPVIALKKGQKILGQIVFVELRERTHNAEIESDIAPEHLGRIGHIDVSGMHLGVEESVVKHLFEENFDTSRRHTLAIDPQPPQLPGSPYGYALHAMPCNCSGGSAFQNPIRDN